MSNPKPRVLCVDDEPRVLEGLRLTLGRKFRLETAVSGAAALELVAGAGEDSFAVIISDMRMPGMNGAEVLAAVRSRSPDTVRVLLTGHADLDSAILAVNEGQIFRFLTKPCPPEQLTQVVHSAVRQFELIRSERVLLEQTLRGAIHMLTDAMGMVSPTAFGKAASIREHAAAIAIKLGAEDRWAIEIAAMLSQVAVMTLPPNTAEKWYSGMPLSRNEAEMIAQLPRITDQLLANIPRVELVRNMLGAVGVRFDDPDAPGGPHMEGARILAAAIDFDLLETQGSDVELALETLLGRKGRYDPRVLDALSELHGGAGRRQEVLELPLVRLRPGMVLADHVRTRTGNIICAPGNVIGATLLERLKNFSKSVGLREPIRVVVRSLLPEDMEPHARTA